MHHYYSYAEFLSDCKTLTKHVNWEFDAIVAIARGGMTLAHMLGEFYNIREVYVINTIGYDEMTKLDQIALFNIPDLKQVKKVLVVDDIVDSGDTMKLVLETFAKQYPQCEFRSAALFYKKLAVVKPNWYVKHADVWIDFFWSVDLKRV
ncbi:MAG: phosphoribosyltransferase family protein [Campylobacterota bacterium]|nr:phosphoribosyltransferase family protein [Campylobacterota bacterium]